MSISNTDPIQRPVVVLAEDEPATRALIARQVSAAGFDVRAYENGRLALDGLRDLETALIIADWHMPEMDGVALCRAVRELREAHALRSCFFLLLTAESEVESIVEGLEAGADDYLTKPYHRQELLARLRAGQRINELQQLLWGRQVELERVNAQLGHMAKRMEKLANTDALTGLSNRRHFFERADEQWSLARRHDHPFSCVMFDIDHFKRVNDTYGHAAGDHVLREVAALIRAEVPKSDVFGRIGGEEFCVMMFAAQADGAAQTAERLRSMVESAHLAFEGREIPVTLSLGVAERSERHDSVEALIADADQLLYRAKESGRNQVWVSSGGGTRFAPGAAVAS
ncbi:MAG: diguanylate cyclase [Phycisphaerales bacterium]|nr:diguanylate cyclase [Phycisphaerales bacterium]